MTKTMTKTLTRRHWGTVVAALTAASFLAGPSVLARSDRPPTTFNGAWSYSDSDSHDGSSRSEALSVAESGRAGSGYADVKVEEMVNGTTHIGSRRHVRYKDVNAVMETLITQTKKDL